MCKTEHKLRQIDFWCSVSGVGRGFVVLVSQLVVDTGLGGDRTVSDTQLSRWLVITLIHTYTDCTHLVTI